MMQAFRNSAKPIVLILTVSFFGWLVFDLSGLSGGSGGLLTKTSVGSINGHAVDARIYQEAVQQAVSQRQQQSPEPLGVADMSQVRDQVWEQFIQQILFQDEYDRRGIRVAPEEVAEAIRQIPPPELQSSPEFQTDGKFDMGKYQRWLSSTIGQGYVPALEGRYREEMMRQKLYRSLISDVYVSNVALWQRYQDDHESARVGVATVDPSIAVSVSAPPIDQSELETYYRDHRTDFERKRTAYLSYVALDRLPNASDTAAARQRAMTLRDEIQGGAPFADVAQRESSDTVSGRKGGDLGEWTRGDFDPQFETAAWSIPLNTVSEPVLTRFGFHLIEITKRSGDKATGRHILVPIELAGAHRDLVDGRADSLEALGADRMDRAALDTVSSALGLPIQETGPILEGSFAAVPPDASIWAFQAKSGEHSPVIETPAFFYVFRVDSLWDEGVPPLATIREDVIRAIRLERQMVVAKQKADAVAQRVRSGETLSAAANAEGIPYQEQGPFTRVNAPLRSGVANGAAFGLPVGETSGVIEGDGVYYLLTVLSRTAADSTAFAADLETQRGTALQAARQEYVQQYLAALRQSARLVDHRADLFRTNAQAEAEAQALAPTARR